MTRSTATLFLITLLFTSAGMAQSPDTVFIRQDHNFDDTLIYATDTIVFESGLRKQILIGTTIIPGTHGQIMAMNYGLSLNKVTKSDCQQDAYEKQSPDRINSIIHTDSTLTIDVNLTANCCYEFLCDISVDSEGTLNLIYQGYGTYCSCECCFGVVYHLEKEHYPDFSEIKAVMINEDRKTIQKIKN